MTWNLTDALVLYRDLVKQFHSDGYLLSIYGSILNGGTAITDSFSAITTGCFDRLTTVAAKKYLRERWL